MCAHMWKCVRIQVKGDDDSGQRGLSCYKQHLVFFLFFVFVFYSFGVFERESPHVSLVGLKFSMETRLTSNS